MLRKIPPLACALAALLLLAPLAAPVRAAGVGEGTASGDSALGGWAAIGCGIMVRATIYTGGTAVGTIAGAIACCGYMIFDAFCDTPQPNPK
jgi:hypothetical protein